MKHGSALSEIGKQSPKEAVSKERGSAAANNFSLANFKHNQLMQSENQTCSSEMKI
jgi:hypothetical protein